MSDEASCSPLFSYNDMDVVMTKENFRSLVLHGEAKHPAVWGLGALLSRYDTSLFFWRQTMLHHHHLCRKVYEVRRRSNTVPNAGVTL